MNSHFFTYKVEAASISFNKLMGSMSPIKDSLLYSVLMLNFSSRIIRFDAVVSADAFENLKPAPDIFLAASMNLNVPPSEVCYWKVLCCSFCCC